MPISVHRYKKVDGTVTNMWLVKDAPPGLFVPKEEGGVGKAKFCKHGYFIWPSRVKSVEEWLRKHNHTFKTDGGPEGEEKKDEKHKHKESKEERKKRKEEKKKRKEEKLKRKEEKRLRKESKPPKPRTPTPPPRMKTPTPPRTKTPTPPRRSPPRTKTPTPPRQKTPTPPRRSPPKEKTPSPSRRSPMRIKFTDMDMDGYIRVIPVLHHKGTGLYSLKKNSFITDVENRPKTHRGVVIDEHDLRVLKERAYEDDLVVDVAEVDYPPLDADNKQDMRGYPSFSPIVITEYRRVMKTREGYNKYDKRGKRMYHVYGHTIDRGVAEYFNDSWNLIVYTATNGQVISNKDNYMYKIQEKDLPYEIVRVEGPLPKRKYEVKKDRSPALHKLQMTSPDVTRLELVAESKRPDPIEPFTAETVEKFRHWLERYPRSRSQTVARFHEVYKRLFGKINVEDVQPKDVLTICQTIDDVYFGGKYLYWCGPGTFNVTDRKSKMIGITNFIGIDGHGKTTAMADSVMINRWYLDQMFTKGETSYRIGGIHLYDKLSVLIVVLSHEMLHCLSKQIPQRNPAGHPEKYFKYMLRLVFGQTNPFHEVHVY